MTLLNLWLY